MLDSDRGPDLLFLYRIKVVDGDKGPSRDFIVSPVRGGSGIPLEKSPCMIGFILRASFFLLGDGIFIKL